MKAIIYLLLIPIIATAYTVTIHPTKDSVVRWENPNDNYGVGRRLTAAFNEYDNSERIDSLISWQELESGETIPSNYDSVILELYVDDIHLYCGGGNLFIYEIIAGWDEMGVTWANRPTRQENPNTQIPFISDSQEFVSIDITDRFSPTGYGLYFTAEGMIDGLYKVLFMSSDITSQTHCRPKIIFEGVGIEGASLGSIKATFR